MREAQGLEGRVHFRQVRREHDCDGEDGDVVATGRPGGDWR
jgi:hypothetical protein